LPYFPGWANVKGFMNLGHFTGYADISILTQYVFQVHEALGNAMLGFIKYD
jgi:hypothetical protein